MTPFELLSLGQYALPAVPDLVVYLHGFRSSSRSVKAQKVIDDFTAAGVGHRLWVPDLPPSPAKALALVEQVVQSRLASNPELGLAFVGSSLGGYYATVLGECHPQARVLLLNPAVKPYDDLVDQLGKKTVYFTEEEFEFVPAYLQELRGMERTSLTAPSRYCLVAAQGDEVLSYATMLARYPGVHQMRLLGSDHAISDFDAHWPLLRLFLGLA
ncbi:YqiA/YcfP family alpha/beta fold hydrolase [Limnobacter sp.]|uniref:YqiA/YcfP family alpha/beta fold hydrolase n=1 Tax=Limnobacter sp. TaxID=2003368 RepID=UPI00351686F0